MNARYISTEPGPGGMDWQHDHLNGMAVGGGDPGKVVAITLLQHPTLAVIADGKDDENMEFIAAAREGWPWAIAEFQHANAEVKRLRKLLDAAVPFVDSVRRTCEAEGNTLAAKGPRSLLREIRAALKEGEA